MTPFILLPVLLAPILAFDFKDGADNVKWSLGCDFYGSDLRNEQSRGEECGGKCAREPQCTHFTWFQDRCYLKKFQGAPIAQSKHHAVCGWVNRGPDPGPINGLKGSGKTTRYWDCCKPSCAWNGKGPSTPVKSCAKDGVRGVGVNDKSGCEDGGTSFACNNNMPWSVNDNLAYGFVAFNAMQGMEKPCCKCFELTFTNTDARGKKMIVQVTNSGSDLSAVHFDIQIPGGGVGIFNGCHSQWGAPLQNGWGQRYGGVSNIRDCDQLPAQIREGCKWRFTWFKGADNPNVDFKEVACPRELTDRTGCTA